MDAQISMTAHANARTVHARKQHKKIILGQKSTPTPRVWMAAWSLSSPRAPQQARPNGLNLNQLRWWPTPLGVWQVPHTKTGQMCGVDLLLCIPWLPGAPNRAHTNLVSGHFLFWQDWKPSNAHLAKLLPLGGCGKQLFYNTFAKSKFYQIWADVTRFWEFNMFAENRNAKY